MKYSGGLLLRALNRVLGHLTQEQLDNITHESLLKETIMYLDGLRDKLAAKWKVRRVTEQMIHDQIDFDEAAGLY